LKPIDQFSGNMLGIGRTAAVAEYEYFMTGGQTFHQPVGAFFDQIQIFFNGLILHRDAFGKYIYDNVLH
jgi:hypothetical protein